MEELWEVTRLMVMETCSRGVSEILCKPLFKNESSLLHKAETKFSLLDVIFVI